MSGLNTRLDPMHPCLNVDEIVRLLARELVVSGWKATAVALACCCKTLEDPILDTLWRTQDRLNPLLETFPVGVWDELHKPLMVFERMPTTAEWARLKKYARRIRELKVNLDKEPIPSDTLSVLQLRILDEPLLPNLKTFELKEAAADIVPLIPLFLSNGITHIDIQFLADLPAVMIASVIIRLPNQCPNMQSITLRPLLDHSTVINAASEMLLTCNLDTLRFFKVDSALTEEANRVVCQLPDLQGLWLVFGEHAPPPVVSLQSLTELDIEYHHGHDWLQAFRGTTLSKLTEVAFDASCERIGDFLQAFESVALATSASATLSKLEFYTLRSWNPSYHSLLSFKQLKTLIIGFSCDDGCSSRVDDEIIIALAQAMPKLEILKLGNKPCQAPSNVTVRGIIALAHHCIGLSRLSIHFRADSLIVGVVDVAAPSASSSESHLPRGTCALTSLEVGTIPAPEMYPLPASLTLLHIFSHLLTIDYVDIGWKGIADTIALSNRIGSFVHRSGRALDIGNTPENEQE